MGTKIRKSKYFPSQLFFSMKLYSLRTLHFHAKSKNDHTDNLDFFLSDLVSWKMRRTYIENFLLCFVKGEEHWAECSFCSLRGHLKFRQDRQKSWLNFGFKQDRQTDRRNKDIVGLEVYYLYSLCATSNLTRNKNSYFVLLLSIQLLIKNSKNLKKLISRNN